MMLTSYNYTYRTYCVSKVSQQEERENREDRRSKLKDAAHPGKLDVPCSLSHVSIG